MAGWSWLVAGKWWVNDGFNGWLLLESSFQWISFPWPLAPPLPCWNRLNLHHALFPMVIVITCIHCWQWGYPGFATGAPPWSADIQLHLSSSLEDGTSETKLDILCPGKIIHHSWWSWLTNIDHDQPWRMITIQTVTHNLVGSLAQHHLLKHWKWWPSNCSRRCRSICCIKFLKSGLWS